MCQHQRQNEINDNDQPLDGSASAQRRADEIGVEYRCWTLTNQTSAANFNIVTLPNGGSGERPIRCRVITLDCLESIILHRVHAVPG